MRCATDGRSVRRRMGMRRIGADRHVHGHRRGTRIRLRQKAGVQSIAAVLGQPLPQRFAHSQAFAIALDDGVIHVAARLFGRAEAAIGQHRFHIFAGVSGERDFEIVDGGRAVEGERRGVAAIHQIDQHRRQPALDHMAAHAPDDGALGGTSGAQPPPPPRETNRQPECAAAIAAIPPRPTLFDRARRSRRSSPCRRDRAVRPCAARRNRAASASICSCGGSPAAQHFAQRLGRVALLRTADLLGRAGGHDAAAVLAAIRVRGR